MHMSVNLFQAISTMELISKYKTLMELYKLNPIQAPIAAGWYMINQTLRQPGKRGQLRIRIWLLSIWMLHLTYYQWRKLLTQIIVIIFLPRNWLSIYESQNALNNVTLQESLTSFGIRIIISWFIIHTFY